jgi:hypothetical protein
MTWINMGGGEKNGRSRMYEEGSDEMWRFREANGEGLILDGRRGRTNPRLCA